MASFPTPLTFQCHRWATANAARDSRKNMKTSNQSKTENYVNKAATTEPRNETATTHDRNDDGNDGRCGSLIRQLRKSYKACLVVFMLRDMACNYVGPPWDNQNMCSFTIRLPSPCEAPNCCASSSISEKQKVKSILVLSETDAFCIEQHRRGSRSEGAPRTHE